MLPAAPEGPLGFGCRDGSLGRLTLPRSASLSTAGFASTSSTGKAMLDLLHDPSGPDTSRRPPSWPCRIWAEVRTSPTTRRNTRRFVHAVSLTADEDILYVVDRGARRVLVLAQNSWALRDLWSFGHDEPPLDAVAHGGRVYVLTTRSVYRHGHGDERPKRILERPLNINRWKRIAVDQEGRLYLLRSGRLRIPDLVDVLTPGQGLAALRRPPTPPRSATGSRFPPSTPGPYRPRFSSCFPSRWPGAAASPSPGRVQATLVEASLTWLPDPDQGEPQPAAGPSSSTVGENASIRPRCRP